MIQAQRVELTNSAWVILDWTVSAGTYRQTASINLTRSHSATVDLAGQPWAEGTIVTPDVVVEADLRRQPPPPPEPVQLTMNGRTAHYEVTGYTYDWTVNAGAVDPPTPPPVLPGFPSSVPLNLLPYSNWDRQIVLPPTLTCAPLTTDDLALVCNWAQDNGYQLRPRGVMHGWSPLTVTPSTPSNGRVLLVDLTKGFAGMELLPAGNGLPTRVRVGAGATMLELLTFLEAQPGGGGSAPGYSFPHTPAPGDLTVGGVLAIGAHGTAVPGAPGDDFAASYGSLSNQVVDLTVVATDPANPGARYTARTLTRDEPATKAVLTHVGRALVTEATLQVVPNYNLRCLSITDLPSATIFAAPTVADPVPANSFASFLDSMGRVEIIWYPFSDNPWLHTWQVAPTKPSSSIAVSTPFNYPFADYVPDGLQNLITHLVNGDPSLTPAVGQMAARVTAFGLDGENWAGVSGTYPVSRDIWGPSKNSLLYIQATTLKVTANGYAIHLRRADVQQAVHDLIGQYTSMLTGYAAKGSYPVNSALELRVTALDDPSRVGVAAAESPVISALGQGPVDVANGWDIAVWFDVLTIPGTEGADQFYAELETWLIERFSGTAGAVLPEWSKGWAYTATGGPWTSTDFLTHVRSTVSDGRSNTDDWAWEAATLTSMDGANLFTNPFLGTLFG